MHAFSPVSTAKNSHKHLFKHGFLDILQFFELTLMKGDKVVELAEVVGNELLLLHCYWVTHACFLNVAAA